MHQINFNITEIVYPQLDKGFSHIATYYNGDRSEERRKTDILANI